MNGCNSSFDPAISIMTLDLLGQILSRSDNAKKLGDYLSEEIRELTGARCVLLVRGDEGPDRFGRAILTIHPERKREWAESPEVLSFLQGHVSDASPVVWNARDEDHRCPVLEREGYDLSFAIPLRAGEVHAGSLFALGLPDIIHLDSVISLISSLSATVALVMRNASLFEHQEHIIEERTAQVHAAYEEVRSELVKRKQIEDDLRSTNAYLENLISYSNVPIIIWDTRLVITRINHAGEELTGRGEEEVCGKPVGMLFPEWEGGRIRRLLQTTLEGVRWEEVGLDLLHKDTSIRKVIWNSSTIYAPDGSRPVAVIAQGRDVTDELRLEEEKDAAIAQIQKNLAQLAVLNDEIRNPLTIIMAYIDSSMNSPEGERILHQINRIDEIVKNLDLRWIQSEKVLTAIRKHYHLSMTPPGQPGYQSSSDTKTRYLENSGYEESGNGDLLIQEAQANLYMTLDSIDSLVFVTDISSGEILFMNRGGRELFGSESGEALFREILDRTGDSGTITADSLIPGTAHPPQNRGEHHHPLTDRWYDCRDRSIRWTDGRVVRLLFVTDITERKRVEESLRERTDQYLKLVNSIPDYILVQRDGRILFINQAAATSFGYDSSELIGSHITQFLTPESAKVVTEMMKVRDRDEMADPYEITVLTKDGKPRVTTVQGIRIQYEGGPASLNVLTDVTGHKRMLQELREKDELFSEFIRHSPIYTYIKTVTPAESRVLYASDNFEQMIGICGSDMVGKTMYELFPPDFAAKITADDWAVVARGEILNLTETLNGRVHISVKFPIVQKHRTLLGGYTIDITDWKHTEELLQEANLKIRLLTGITRHDIFNQISMIQGLLSLAADEENEKKKRDYLSRSLEVCTHIESTIRFTKEYENLGEGSGRWQKVRALIQSAATEISFGPVSIRILIPENLEIFADLVIRKVFSTLLDNAIRHNEAITAVWFSYQMQGDSLVIVCEDDGTGIPEDEKERIFEHKFGKNTGIGLFLAREILSITGISIRECGREGSGARFEILVPSGKFRFLSATAPDSDRL